MRITQGTFSYLPDFSEEEIKLQIRYCLDNGWPISIEYTEDPHPRNAYWEMWDLPMFDMKNLEDAMLQIQECREAFPNHYIKLNGYDRTKGRQTTMLSFIVHRAQTRARLLVGAHGRPRSAYQIHHSFQSYADGLAHMLKRLGSRNRNVRRLCKE